MLYSFKKDLAELSGVNSKYAMVVYRFDIE